MPARSPARRYGGPGPAGSADVPFVARWDTGRPFADLGASSGVIDPPMMLRGWAEKREMTARGGALEAEVAGWDTVPAGLMELLARHRRAVARIVVPPGHTDYLGRRSDGGWNGTGFLVGPNLLLTNHHVLNSVEVAGAATIEFNYEWPAEKLFANVAETDPPAVRFKLAPSRLFVTSPAVGEGLDFTFAWISERASEQFGTIRMERGSFMIAPYEPTFLIHHPQGRLKEVSLDDTELLGVNATCLLYAADTHYGSSGAAVFNKNGRLVALHHARRAGAELKRLYPDAPTILKDGRSVDVANEGIKISAIALDLEGRMRGAGKDADNAGEILRNVAGSDTLTGIFGGLGRSAASESASDHQRVLDLYRSGNQDVDVGFWNMHWMEAAMHEAGRLDETAAAMTDLNLDVWCLVEAPPAAVEGIVSSLHRKFGEAVSHRFTDPEAQHLRRVTAVLWRPGAVDCQQVAWPAAMDPLWTRAVPGMGDTGGPAARAFRHPPPLMHLRRPDGRRVANLVPVSLRPLGSDEIARRFASRLLVHAIDLAIAEGDCGGDWIVGGDFRPPLAREDSKALNRWNYQAMAARDEQRGGALSYLRSETSPVRNVFVTSDLSPIDDDREFFEVVRERTVDKFFKSLADNRPAVLRMSLAGDQPELSESRLDRIFRDTLGAIRPRDPDAASDWARGLQCTGLDKPAFMRANRAQWRRLIERTTRRLSEQYGDVLPVSETDLWVMVYAEAGLRNGAVDADARHSNGERGLLPLPNNIEDWNGPGAPAWDRPMALETNLEHYALYLGQLKNKPVASVAGRTLYRDLFRIAGLAASPVRQARLLAGIVHGYFVGANYGGRKVPLDHLLASYRSDARLDEMLAGTGYVHAGKTLLGNRHRNIERAIEDAAGGMI